MIGPTIKVLVSPDEVEFSAPGPLLQDCSTYFRAALQGPFRENREGMITLDNEEVEVFRTFILWLFRQKITHADLIEFSDDPAMQETHLVKVYAFADRRGIRQLGNNAVTLMAESMWRTGSAVFEALDEAYKTFSSDTPLCRLFVNREVSALRSRLLFMNDKDMGRYPTRYTNAVLRRALEHRRLDFNDCLAAICDYHDHRDSSGLCRYPARSCGECTSFN